MADRSNSIFDKSASSIDRRSPSASQLRLLAADVQNRLLAEDTVGAANAYAAHRKSRPDWTLEEPDLMALIRALHDHKLWSASIRPMVDYLRQYPERSVRMRFRLAEILLSVERRPTKAIEILEKIQVGTLPPDLRNTHAKLLIKANEVKAVCGLEVADGEDW